MRRVAPRPPADADQSTRRRILAATFVVLARDGRRKSQLSDVAAEAPRCLGRRCTATSAPRRACSRRSPCTNRTTSTRASPLRSQACAGPTASTRHCSSSSNSRARPRRVACGHRARARHLPDAALAADHARANRPHHSRRAHRYRGRSGGANRRMPLHDRSRQPRGVPGRTAPRRRSKPVPTAPARVAAD